MSFRTIENFRLVEWEKLDNLPNNTNSELLLKEDKVNKSTNTNLGNSDVLYPSQNAVKEYVDAQVATATIPDATTAVKWKVKLAWDLSWTADLPTVPALWNKVDKTTTVNGKSLSANVVLTTDDVWEWATNKYDKTVTLTSWNDINITWSYPNFTIESTAKWHIIQDEWVDVSNRWKLNFKDWFTVTDNAWNNSTDIWIEFEQIPNYNITNANEDRQLNWSNTTLNEVVDVLWTLIQDVENTAFIAWDWMKKAIYDPNNKNKEVAFDDEVLKLTEKWTNNWVAELDWNWKVPTSQLPAIAITETFVVNSQVAQLALTAQEWDVCIRTDQNKSYIHNGWTAGTMADWQELLTPTDTVSSVAGKTWNVTLVKWDVGLWNVDNTSDVNKPVSTAQQTALNNKIGNTELQALSSVFIADVRDTNKQPDQYVWRREHFEFNQAASIWLSLSEEWVVVHTIAKWSNHETWHRIEQMVYWEWKIFRRFSASWTTWWAWFELMDTTNNQNVFWTKIYNWDTTIQSKELWPWQYTWFQFINSNWTLAWELKKDNNGDLFLRWGATDVYLRKSWKLDVNVDIETYWKFIGPIRETRASDNLFFWTWTQAQYNAIWTKNSRTLYIITDA